MKWLFAILVALNIVVFGSMVAGKLIRAENTSGQYAGTAPAPTPAAENVVPAEPDIRVDGAAAGSATASSTPSPSNNPSAGSEKKTAALSDKDTAVPPSAAIGTKTCAAAVEIPEDDYHRIKGLLGRWPNSVNRFVSRNRSEASSKAQSRYRVIVDDANVGETAAGLAEKGFQYTMSSGRPSLGVFSQRSDAEALAAKVKINGFAGARIVEEKTAGDAGPLSISMMRVVFADVDDAKVKAIEAVTGPYGKLQRSPCR